jgi:hydrogenase maturation protease
LRIIALGQRAAGDDGVGVAVLEALRALAPPELELHEISADLDVMGLLQTAQPVLLLDGLVGGVPGAVRVLSLEQLCAVSPSLVSTQGFGLLEAITLARELEPARTSPNIRAVTVGIARPDAPRDGLTAEVAAAVPRAAEIVLDLARDN